MAEVQLCNISKIFENKVTAVDKLNLTVKDRDFLVLVGPSGCGKSTTLRLVAGLEEATEGEIFIGERNVTNLPPKDRDIAMVFQNYALYPHMTVFENLAFGLRMKGIPKERIAERVSEAANILGIPELLSRKPKALSGGQRQRVALGREIVRDAKVFLFDEPLSNLDAKLRVQMRAEIIKLHSRINMTTIYVTHDQVEAMTMGRHIAVMKDGRVQQIDTPMTLYDAPANIFVAGFIGSPAMNFLPGAASLDDGLRFETQGFALHVPDRYAGALQNHIGKKLIFGFRPEDAVPIMNFGAGHVRNMLKVAVEVVEPMGNETLLACSLGKNMLTVRANPSFRVSMGDTLILEINMQKAHFFNADSEARITPHD